MESEHVGGYDSPIFQALENGRKYLLSIQQEDGSWVNPVHDFKVLPCYQQPLVLTSEAMSALLLHGNYHDLPQIEKAFLFCRRTKLLPTDYMDAWAFKLQSLLISNLPTVKVEAEEILQYLLDMQDMSGTWPTFPSGYNLTNFTVIMAIKDIAPSSNLELARKWLLKHKAKDSIGWGFDFNSKASELSYTCNVACALLSLGEDPTNANMQKIRKFIEDRQFKTGGWPASTTTYASQPTVYGTSLALLTLLQLVKDPLKDQSILNAINYLIDQQQPDGNWKTFENQDGQAPLYPTFFAMQALSYYLLLKRKLTGRKYTYLRGKMKTQHLSTYLITNISTELRKRLGFMKTASLSNSKLLGTSAGAIERRKIILHLMSDGKLRDVAQVIDELKKYDDYSHLNKKYHLTQVKNDLSHLADLSLITLNKRKYFMVSQTVGFSW